jgi:hypothetical protein
VQTGQRHEGNKRTTKEESGRQRNKNTVEKIKKKTRKSKQSDGNKWGGHAEPKEMRDKERMEEKRKRREEEKDDEEEKEGNTHEKTVT